MASIRRFFEKKRTDRKFKQAGPGHSLTEEGSQSGRARADCSSGQPSQGHVYQRQKSSEATKAGEAALKRFEKKSQESSRPVSSRAAWKNSATTTVNQESLRQQIKAEVAGEIAAAHIIEKPKELSLESSPTLAVAGIFFRCPLCPACLSEAEMPNHLEGCLMNDVHVEPAMTTALMIHTLNKSRGGTEACITILKKYLNNILTHPEEEKYRKIKKSNKVFKEKVAPYRGVSEFLTLGCGFAEEDIATEDSTNVESFYVLPEALAKDQEKLKLMIEFLEEAEALEPTLDRSVRVLAPGSGPDRIELPRDFYHISSAEVKREQQAMSDTVEKSKQLRTKAMRDMDAGQDLRKYRFSVIRIRFPDGFVLQGTFYSREPLSNILKFVSECVNDSCPLYTLVTSTGDKLQDDSKSIASLGLSPAAVLNFLPDDSLGNTRLGSEGFLLPGLLTRIELL